MVFPLLNEICFSSCLRGFVLYHCFVTNEQERTKQQDNNLCEKITKQQKHYNKRHTQHINKTNR